MLPKEVGWGGDCQRGWGYLTLQGVNYKRGGGDFGVDHLSYLG